MGVVIHAVSLMKFLNKIALKCEKPEVSLYRECSNAHRW